LNIGPFGEGMAGGVKGGLVLLETLERLGAFWKNQEGDF
jgi:hypothetical protein